MSRPRFLADHDLNNEIIGGVIRIDPSIEFVPVRLLAQRNIPDPALLELAAAEGLIVVSHDVNTMRGHAYKRIQEGLKMPGLLLAHQLDPIGPIIESLAVIALASEAEEWPDVVRYLPL